MTDIPFAPPAAAADFPVDDHAGAWVPHGRYTVGPHAAGPLSGLTFAAKDLFDVAGHVTGAGNPDWLATHAPAARNSPVIDTLLDHGATLVGKTLTDELAYSIQGDNAHYGTPLNTRAPDRVPGGSSSGSAAAVAAQLCDFALGTDTGGSTRVPASYCGIWGLRTTHGLLPATGLVPLSPRFDCQTWLAHDADVFARVAAVLAPDAGTRFTRALLLEDACAEADATFAAPLQRVRTELERMLAAPLATASVAATTGADLEHWRTTYVTASAYDAWQVHRAWITDTRPVFGAAVAGRWKLAADVEAADAQAAFARQADLIRQMRALLGSDGVAVLPSASSVALARDAGPAEVDTVRTRTMRITCIAGLAGLPQVSLPFLDADGLPVGVSLMGPAGSDLALVRLAVRIGKALGCLGASTPSTADASVAK